MSQDAIDRGRAEVRSQYRRVAGATRRVMAAAWRRAPVSRVRLSRLRPLNDLLLRMGAPALAVARMQPGHLLVVDLRSGTEWAAYWTGRYDDGRIAVAQELLDRPGAVAVDAGANIGFWSVPLAKRAADVDGRLVALEPVPTNAERLEENLARNGVGEIADVHRVAVSDSHESAVITLREDFQSGARTGNAALEIRDGGDAHFQTVTVPIRRLDDLLDVEARVRVMKADIEGHEDRFLMGAMRTLRRCRPVAFLEWNRVYHRRRGVDPSAAVSALLDELDYRCLVRDANHTWRIWRTYGSTRPVDDLVIAPAGEADHVLSLLDTHA